MADMNMYRYQLKVVFGNDLNIKELQLALLAKDKSWITGLQFTSHTKPVYRYCSTACQSL
jgi:hypothetical protein